jgi:hypothetical protein
MRAGPRNAKGDVDWIEAVRMEVRMAVSGAEAICP